MAREGQFQAKLIREIKEMLPDCIVLKTDANHIQGFPDLLVLYEDRWAALECKAYESSSHQPNQDYYVNLLRGMSYAAFVFPENKERVLNELYETLRAC